MSLWRGRALAWLVAAAFVAAFCGAALPATAQDAPVFTAELAQQIADQKIALDTVWVLVAGVMVFFMNLGFALVESGFCRAKNCVNILFKNFVVFSVASLAFLILGWGLMFGDGNGFMGTHGLFFVSGADNSPLIDGYAGVYGSISWSGVPLWAKFFFQLVFAGTAATIVSGAVAERIKFPAFVIFTVVMVAIIYPIGGHWIWGGGWLADRGMLDFAGSTVVHSVGGWAALTGAMVLGPRLGKYSKEGKPQAIPGHNMTAAATGVIVLWFGWFGFNPGSTMGADFASIAHIAVTTNTAAAAATIGAMITAWLLLGKPDLGMALNGALAGLVAITAPCAFVSVPASLVIGLIAGFLVVVSVLFFDRIKIDDPVGATSVHLVNGVFGTLAVGLWSKPGVCPAAVAKAGLFNGGGMEQLMPQIIGVVAVGAFVFVVSLVVWMALKVVLGGIRVYPDEEREGLDIGEHRNVAYPDFQQSSMSH
jgi:Amt family ammonium transporter